MKQCLFVLIVLIFGQNAESQVLKTLGERAKAKIAQRANNKVDQTMEKGLDEIEEEAKKKNSDGDNKIKSTEGKNGSTNTEGSNAKSEGLSFNSKYDFIPGEKIVAFEDFSRADVGDFPTNWNTNATAEVVTINGKEGKWLKLNKEGVWMPEFINSLPENFTLEFDLGVSKDFDGSVINLNIANLKSRDKDYTDFYHYVTWRHGHALHMEFKPSNGRGPAIARIQTATDGNYLVNNTSDFKNWDNNKNNFAHISLWRQKERLRVYINGEKVFDVPKAFTPGGKYNMVNFAMQGSNNPELHQYFLNNLRLAVGAPDTRNKLMTEGKFVTRGILFDVGSDRIKPESYGAAKDIAAVLKEAPSVKVKIVGHTDSDGDDKANQTLSEKRAAAVKAYLVKEFGVDGTNINTEGKGESQPTDKNTTAEGKANNRRVEFIKM